MPEGFDGWTRGTFEVARQIDPEYRKQARTLSANYADAANGLQPGDAQQPPKYATVAEAFAGLKKVNNETINKDAWDPFHEFVVAKHKSKTLRYGKPEYVKMLNSISEGLIYAVR